MNSLILLPFILLGVPFAPAVLEILKRKDKGPKEIPEQTTYEEKPDVDTPLLERAREYARVKVSGEMMRITGDASIPDGTEINNHLVVQGKLKVGKNCHIIGSVKAFSSIEIGESSVVEGHVLSEGTIIIGRDCIIKGVVDSPKDITLEENAVVEAVSTEKTVKIGFNAKINRRVLSGSSIVASSQNAQTKVVEKPVEAMGTTEQIFSHLEERIKKFDENKSVAVEEFNLEDLSPLEAEVLKIAIKCSSFEEVCLRLLMDSSEVKDILDKLVKKGLLDETLKPKNSFKKEHVELAPAEQISLKNPQDTSLEILSENELIERLIASKMRKELKRKIQVKEGEILERGQLNVLDEWKRLSNSLWGAKEETEV